MFDIGTGEVIALAVIALLVLGPEKLPRYASEAARFLRQMRSLANDARREVQRELGPELDGIGLRELNPRALVRKHLTDGFDGPGGRDGPDGRDGLDRPDRLDGTSGSRRAPAAGRTGGSAERTPPPATPYDPDAT